MVTALVFAIVLSGSAAQFEVEFEAQVEVEVENRDQNLVQVLSQSPDSTSAQLITAGYRHFQANRYDEARGYFDRAHVAAIRDNESRRELLAMWYNVLIENRQYRYESALVGSIRLYDLSAARSDTLMMMRALFEKGHVFYENNDTEKAHEVYGEIQELAEGVGNRRFLANATRIMGQLHSRMRQVDAAMEKYSTSIDLYKDMNDTTSLIRAYNFAAVLYNENHDINTSIHYSRMAMELSEASGNIVMLATQLFNLSNSYSAMGDYVSALQFAKRSLEFRRNLHLPLSLSYSLYQIANLYYKTGQFELALAFNEECIAIERKHLTPAELIYTLTQGAAIFEMLDRHEDARRYSREAIDISYRYNAWHRISAPMRNLARSYITGNEPEKAIELLNEGLAMIDSTGQDDILGDFYLFRGIAYNLTGNHTGALDDYKNAIAHIKTFPLRIVPPSYYFHLARGYRHLGSDSAYVYAREFIESNNRYRENIRLSAGLRAGFMSRFIDQYHEIARWYLEDLQDVVQAYNIIEQARARTFAESVADAATDFSSDLDDDLQAELKEAEARLQKSELDVNRLQTEEAARESELDVNRLKTEEAARELRDAGLAYEVVISKIRSSDVVYDRFHNPEPLTMSQARKLIDRNTAVISYAFTSTHLIGIAFSATRSTHWTVEFDQAPGAGSLASSITDFRSAIESGQPVAEINIPGAELAAMLIDPAGEVTDGMTNLIIVTDGPLSYLPFEALPRGDSYLISEFNLKYAPSMTVYSLLPEERTGYDRDMFILSNPDFGDPEEYSLFVNTPATRLPHTRIEADSVASRFSRVSRYHGAGANEAVFRAQDLSRYRYLHLATHGVVNEQNPRMSGLLLASAGHDNPNGYDAFLRVPEIHTLNLNADLVVLSACNTGLGQILKGEGVLGLQRAFFLAGTSSVMVSLWSVQDRSTASLMARFYRELHNLGDQENT
ncbi:MAG: CHAT domain-containing protein, partial [Cyclonatronaceae bacterium]